jgi:hypothetical protein
MTRSAGRQIVRAKRTYGGVRIPLAQMAALTLAFVLFSFAQLAAQEGKPSEYRVKAVYLYNFGKFVQWPAGIGSEGPEKVFPICILGHNPFGLALDDTVKDENIEGLPLVAKRIERVEDVDNCRILFIDSSEKDRLIKTLQALQSKPMLTVSDMPDFCNRGGMIQFVLQADKIRFEVNLAPAEKAGLTFSSQLLKVATSVQRNP